VVKAVGREPRPKPTAIAATARASFSAATTVSASASHSSLAARDRIDLIDRIDGFAGGELAPWHQGRLEAER
jgi:hypothetical protein